MTPKSQKQQGDSLKATATPIEGITPLLDNLRELIAESRQQLLRAVDVVQVQTYWHIGQHIVEFEQSGAQRAAYGQRLLPQLGQVLAAEFGRGFDATNLRHMRAFYQAFPIRDAVRRELSWTHYRLLLRVDSPEARQWYVQEVAAQNWSTRALEQSPRAFVRDPMMLEFLGLPETGEGDNPTVGILLCGSKDKSVVRYSVLNGSEQLFASKYRLILPSEEELRQELQRDREEIETQKSLRNEDNQP